MITKEQAEAAEKRIAEAEKTIAADKALVTQYNEHLRKNLNNELADIICRSGVIDYPNMVVDSVEVHRPARQPFSDAPQFDIVLHCISFRG